jgi:ubiquitin-conjugating enzyme E2 Q
MHYYFIVSFIKYLYLDTVLTITQWCVEVRPGDDEGSIELIMAKPDPSTSHLLSLNLLISDTSDYPKSHNFFSYSPDADISSSLQEVIDEIPNLPPKTVGETIAKLCTAVAKAAGLNSGKGGVSASQETEMDSDEGGSEYDMDEYDEDFGEFLPPGATKKSQLANMAVIQRLAPPIIFTICPI